MRQNILSCYGDCIATYRGKGKLTLLDNQIVPCSFEVGQLRKGTVLLICDFSPPPPYIPILSARYFEGVTDEGFPISTAGPITETEDLTDDVEDLANMTLRLAFLVSEITIQIASGKPISQARFGITNLMLDEPFTLCLPNVTNITNLSLEFGDENKRVMKRVRTLKTIDVTCEVSIALSEEEGRSLKAVMENLCYLLSVVQGTKIQWIYCYLYDETGALIGKQHSSNVTKACCPGILIEGSKETKVFIESTYNSYVTNRERYKLATGLIDAYLDAKAEQDYLQMRGIKLVVAVEMLKDMFLHVPGVIQGGELILPKQLFDIVQSYLKNPLGYILSILGVDETDQSEIGNKIEELNRRSFKPILKSILKHIDLTLAKNELDLFVTCRNKLVHTGAFFSETATKKELKRYKVSFDSTGKEEYYFLINTLNKMFLKLLGYSGPYVDEKIQEGIIYTQILQL